MPGNEQKNKKKMPSFQKHVGRFCKTVDAYENSIRLPEEYDCLVKDG